jgi:DNA repair exonuclease SbcCD nuclease subunit
MAVTLLHTADWQIGKRFGEIPGDAGALLREQRLATVEAIARLAAGRAVDAVLVAGDVLDDNAVADRTIRRMLNAMAGYGGPWLLLPGNHDPALAESVWTRIERLGRPDNVHLLPRPEPWLGPGFAVLPAPLARRHEAADVTAAMDSMATAEGLVRIGLAHGGVADRLPGPSESPSAIAPDRAERAGLAYLALGDWHGTLEIAPRTWYAGTPEPDRFRANDPGNVLVVTIGNGTSVERVPVGRYRWRRVEVTLHGPEDLAGLDHALDSHGAPFESLLVRLELSGTVDLATRAALDERLAAWEARLAHLRIRDRLVEVPSEDDLGRIDQAGFVRTAVERLVVLRDHPEQGPLARRALRMLYAEQAR